MQECTEHKMLTPSYITGFCEGEAAFTYSRSGRNYALYFAIKSTADDNALVQQIHDFFGVGKIYNVRPRTPRGYGGFTRKAVYYRVSKIEQLERIVTHFDNYPLVGKKRHSYAVWKKMFYLKKAFRKPDFERLHKLADELSSLTTKNTATKIKYV